MNKSDTPGFYDRSTENSFYPILKTFNRRAELYRLVAWAKRKRLAGPLRLYQSRVIDEERRLFRFRLESPRKTTAAYSVHRFAYILFPPTRYPAKRSARGYKRHVS